MSTHTIAGLRKQFKATGKFHTPPELALQLRALLPEHPRDAYDPTCGAGALLSVFPPETPKYGQDIDPTALQDAALIPNMHTQLGDVLTDPAWLDHKFHAITANPPFSIQWQPLWDERFLGTPTIPTKSRADFAFIIHILHMLADDGVAAALQFPGVLYRGGREQQLRQWIIENNWVDQVIAVPGDTFTDTTIATAILVLRKDRGTKPTIRMEDQETGLHRDVPITEIAENQYNLAVNSYVYPEPEPAPVYDPRELQETTIAAALSNLRSSLLFQKHVCEFEGWDFEPIRARALDTIQNL